MADPAYVRAPIQDVTNLELTVLYQPIKGIDKKAVFLVNEGVSPITYTIYTSPSGIRTTDQNPVTRAKYTASEVAKEWAENTTGTLNAGASLHLNMDLITATYIKVTAYVGGAYAYVGVAAQIRTWFMGIDAK